MRSSAPTRLFSDWWLYAVAVAVVAAGVGVAVGWESVWGAFVGGVLAGAAVGIAHDAGIRAERRRWTHRGWQMVSSEQGDS